MKVSEAPPVTPAGTATASTVEAPAVEGHWLPVSSAKRLKTEIYADPRGISMELPSDLQIQHCWRCKIGCVRLRELGKSMRRAVIRYVNSGVLAQRSPHTSWGRAPCLCLACGDAIKGKTKGDK